MGTYLTPTIIAKEALIVLENNMVLANLVHQDYSREYQKVGATVIVRKPTTFSSTAVSDTVNMGTATESSVAVVLNRHLDVTFQVTTQELSLNIVDFSQQLIEPAMKAHAQTIDAYLAAEYINVAGHYAVNATPAVGDILNLRKVQNILKVPMTDRRLVLGPVAEAKYLGLDAFLHASKRGDGGQAVREAELGRVLGYDTYMDQNIASQTTGGYAAAASVVILNTAGTVGGTIIAMKNGVQNGTLNAGDVFKLNAYNEWFVVTQAATAEGGAGTIQVPVQPPLLTAFTNGSTVTFQQSHVANLAFHKNAFAMVTAPLAPPIGGADAKVLNWRNLSARVVYDYTMMTKTNLISIDMLVGFKTLDRNLAARLTDAN